MKNNKLSTYFLAKNISYEILIEEQLQLKSEATRRVLERFSKRRSSLKLKFVSYKFINSIIFGILPIFPLIAYLELSNFFVREAVHIQIAIFTKSLIFQIFFTLQFLDFFLMGLFNLINIMSGEIFEWFKTLPLPKKKLKKLAFFTIIHNFDLPILANIFVFPIIMLFATQNMLIFLISLGTSLLNTVFSITVLIILGEKIAKRIKIKNVKAKKSLLFQLLNTLSYALIIFGSIFIVQMTLSSLVNILMTFLNLYNSPLYNLILSLIPFPFNPSYLISLFSSTSHITIQLWLNTLFGLALYLILIYFFYRKSLKSLNNIISLKYKFNKNYLPEKIDKLKIRISSVIKAFIRKDLLIISRNLQIFMGIIMPVIMSFVFMTFFNISFVRGEDLLSGDLYYPWITLLGLSPLLSAMIVYNLLNMEASGKTIMGTLPISVRDHAKAKLVIMIVIQIIATLTPTLVYLFHYRFVDLLLTVLTILPFVLNFLMLTFLLRVRLFGKKRYFHVLDEILPENKMSKWILIFFLDYLIYFLFILISNYLYYNFDVVVSLLILFIISLSFMAILKVIFDNFFPKSKAHTALKAEKPGTEKIPSKIIIQRLVYTIAFVIYINFYFISIFLYQNFEISLLLLFIGVFLTLAKAVSKRVKLIGTKNKKLSIKKKEILKYIVNSFLKHFLIFFILITVFFFFFNEMYVSPLTPEPVQQLVADWNQLPLWERYLIYLKNLFTGNWEYSIAYFENREIKEKILADGSVTLTILIIPLCLRLLFAFKDGSLQNHKKNWKKFVGKAPLLGFAIPSFFLLLYMPFYFGFGVFSQLNYRILIAISILTVTSLGRVALIRRKNEFSPINHINSALTQRKKRKKSSFKPLKSLNFSNIFSISFLFGELIIIEKILFLTGWGFSFLFALSRSNFIEITAIFFLLSLLIISISFIQSLFKLYLYIKIS
ncbi:MAG: hypothetical protein WBH31_09620 [Promethearchaeia archaeon]